MQSNPLHFLTDRQLQALAGLEGLTVPQILAKYRNFRTKEASPTRSGNKAPQSKSAQAMRMLHSGEASSLQEAWDLVRGRKVVRGTRLKNPKGRSRSPSQSNAAKAMRLYHSGQASSLQEAWDIVRGGRR